MRFRGNVASAFGFVTFAEETQLIRRRSVFRQIEQKLRFALLVRRAIAERFGITFLRVLRVEKLVVRICMETGEVRLQTQRRFDSTILRGIRLRS